MGVKSFLDSNVLVYAFDSRSPDKQRCARRCIETGLVEEDTAVSPQVLSEFFVVVTRKVAKPMSAVAALEVIETLQSLVAVDIDYGLVTRAVEASVQFKISYWDGLIIAAAERAECRRILSEDLSAGQDYWGIRVENPFQ